MAQDFITRITPPAHLESSALWFIFCDKHIVLIKEAQGLPIPQHDHINPFGFKLLYQNYLGTWQHQHCFCAEIESSTSLPETLILEPLRQAGLTFGNELFNVAGRALQILQWDKNHQFCGRCGEKLVMSTTERAKLCNHCQMTHYPRISPSIIVLIKRGKDILLARSPHFTLGIYSTLAGFIEAGETAEQAVEREVMEEVGIRVKNLQYRCSQPWPFPDSLMLGFTAEHTAGEITIDGVEIEDAGWFNRDNLPELPASISIARKLINLFIEGEF